MKHIGLFEGIGGFSLAARWMGWETIAWCEWNEFCQKVLSYYFPNAKKHGDITKTDFTIYRGKCDILTGGFPCQPYSLAGKRKGKEDERHLWPEMLRAIREIRPAYVVGENVFGLINWNGGMVFNEVQTDLEAEGYEVFAFVLPACAVGAPHRRDRIWFVAHAIGRTAQSSGTSGRTDSNGGAINPQPKEWRGEAELNTGCSTILRTDSNTNGQPIEQKTKRGRKINSGKRKKIRNELAAIRDTITSNTEGSSSAGQTKTGRITEKILPNDWQNFPTQSPICGGDDGLPSELDGITFPKWRKESIKAYGNAIVPQVALQIYKAIEAYDSQP